MSKKKNEEYICIDSFIQHLKEIDSEQDITHCEEYKDPPDFWVCIDGVKYAVEVTSIVDDIGFDALCEKFLKDIRIEFVKSNNIKGTYALSIMRKPTLPKKTTVWKALVSTTITRIQQMSSVSGRSESTLINDKNGYVKIEKWSDEGAIIGRCMIKTSKWEGEVQKELTQLIQKRINAKQEKFENKRKRLEKKGVLDWAPNIILILYDAYGYGDVGDTHKAFLEVQGYDWLHSIYFSVSFTDSTNILYPTKPGRKGIFLYSKYQQWYGQ